MTSEQIYKGVQLIQFIDKLKAQKEALSEYGDQAVNISVGDGDRINHWINIRDEVREKILTLLKEDNEQHLMEAQNTLDDL